MAEQDQTPQEANIIQDFPSGPRVRLNRPPLDINLVLQMIASTEAVSDEERAQIYAATNMPTYTQDTPLEELVSALVGHSPSHSLAARKALSERQTLEAVQALVKAFKAREVPQRTQSLIANTLGGMGKIATSALPALRAVLKDKRASEILKATILEAIEKIQGKGK